MNNERHKVATARAALARLQDCDAALEQYRVDHFCDLAVWDIEQREQHLRFASKANIRCGKCIVRFVLIATNAPQQTEKPPRGGLSKSDQLG